MRFRYFLTEYGGANWLLGRVKLIRPTRNQELKVLVYHHIPTGDLVSFEKQISFLRERFAIVEPDIFVQPERYRSVTKPKILITFDDGFQSQFAAARQVLSHYNVKALFFIPTGFIDLVDQAAINDYVAANFFGRRIEPRAVSSEMRPMTWDNVADLLAIGHAVGAHTVSHAILNHIPDESRLRGEIIAGGDRLQEKLGLPVVHFAVPYGNTNCFDQRVLTIAAERYKFCHTTVRGNNRLNQRPFLIRRDPLLPGEPLSYAWFVANNGLGAMYRRQARDLKKFETRIRKT